MNEPLANQLIGRFDALRAKRGTYEADLQDIVELVRPEAVDFNRQTSEGQSRGTQKYDGTAGDALNNFAAGLCSFLTSPTERWFELEVENYDIRFDPDAAMWLELVSDQIYEVYRYSITGFQTAIHEAFLDVGSLGTCVVNQELSLNPRRHISIKTVPLARSYLAEDENGHVDTVFRKVEFSTRSIWSKFSQSNDSIHKKIQEEPNPDRLWPLVHCVFPRKDSAGRDYASIWVDLTHKIVMRDSGFNGFPYHVGRWMKFDSEPYGKSPAHSCLPDIRMLNAMEKTNIRAGQKIADPPLMVPDDGFVLPIKTHPGAILYRQPGAEVIEPLLSGASVLPIALEQADRKREQIKECFHVDWLKLGKENQEMTAFEVEDRRGEKLRFLAPMLGRLQTELLGTLISRTYDLLGEMGVLPPAPPTLVTRTLKISYSGGAAKAQLAVKAIATSRFMSDLLPLAQIKPEILDVIDEDAFAQEMAISRGVSRKVLRDPKKLTEIRAARKQQQEMAMMAEVAEPASKALKNVADARQAGL